jgi:hypothetical protein
MRLGSSHCTIFAAINIYFTIAPPTLRHCFL